MQGLMNILVLIMNLNALELKSLLLFLLTPKLMLQILVDSFTTINTSVANCLNDFTDLYL